MNNIMFEVGEVVTMMTQAGMSMVGVVQTPFTELEDLVIVLEKTCALVPSGDGKLSFTPICAQNKAQIQKFVLENMLTYPDFAENDLKHEYLRRIGVLKIEVPGENKLELVTA